VSGYIKLANELFVEYTSGSFRHSLKIGGNYDE
jgi:hypothetical protein